MKRIASALLFMALPGCGVTPFQRFADRHDAGARDLYSAAMDARICALGAVTSVCLKKRWAVGPAEP